MALSLLYLHGTGQKVRSDEWYDALAAAFESFGLDPVPLDSPRLVVPDYVDLLKNPPDRARRIDFPTETPRPRRDRAEQAAVIADHQRRQAHAVRDLGLPGAGARMGLRRLGDTTAIAGRLPGNLPDAIGYLRNQPLRAAILQRILSDLRTRRELVVVAHSLGSVIAIDLLGHLPSAMRIELLLTLGSPAGHLAVQGHNPTRRLPTYFPYEQVRNWVNVLSPFDPVTASVGLARVFPAATDVRVILPVGRHSAKSYLSHRAVAQLVTAPFRPGPGRPTGSRPSDDVPLTREERLVLGALAYAQRVGSYLRPRGRQQRFQDSLGLVRTEVVDTLVQRRVDDGEPVPAALRVLPEDPAESSMPALDLDQALTFLVVNATNNPVAPFDVDVGEAHHKAVVDCWVDLGYTRDGGQLLAESIRGAKAAFDRTPWRRYAAGAVGLAEVAAGPAGLSVADPARRAATARLASALAEYGPGGVLGGVMLAEALAEVDAATSDQAIGLASVFAPDMLQTEVVRRMAGSLAARRLGLGTDDAGWLLLTEWQSDLAMALERVVHLSDEDAPTVRVLRRKLRAVERGLRWMAEHRLDPVLPDTGD